MKHVYALSLILLTSCLQASDQGLFSPQNSPRNSSQATCTAAAAAVATHQQSPKSVRTSSRTGSGDDNHSEADSLTLKADRSLPKNFFAKPEVHEQSSKNSRTSSRSISRTRSGDNERLAANPDEFSPFTDFMVSTDYPVDSSGVINIDCPITNDSDHVSKDSSEHSTPTVQLSPRTLTRELQKLDDKVKVEMDSMRKIYTQLLNNQQNMLAEIAALKAHTSSAVPAQSPAATADQQQ